MEKIDYALQILLLGFSVVLFTLFFLYGIISLFNRIFYHPVRKSVPEQLVNPQRSPEFELSSLELPPSVVAAISAAVFRYLQLQGAAPARVKINVKAEEPGNQKNWAAFGRKNLLENRMEHERLRRKGLYEKV